ncbi:p450 domain containing protein [Asbolus verrucosus]|uniref:p450 domain containing protein n=1 Tax=Asbolus verrucosus TaxID=1661398 RepID=A0A482VE28_ASBVE|nr:p450 domain containing protein [Asbolus verrucosus]
MMEICDKYRPIGKLWLGTQLMIIVTKPEHIHLLTKTFLGKAKQYDFMKQGLGNGLLTAPVEIWKFHRKAINHSFNENILNSYMEIFVKHAKILTNKLEKDFVGIRGSEIIGHRFLHPLYQFDFVWDLCALSKELVQLTRYTFTYVTQIVARKKAQNHGKNQTETKNFISYLMKLTYEKLTWTEKELVDEVQTMMAAGADTTALIESFFMLMMAIHQEIQVLFHIFLIIDKIHQELLAIFGNDDRNVILDDLAQMAYLERAIKETMRLFPVGPVLGRCIDEDFVLDKCVLPNGSSLIIPVALVHRDPSIWKNPLKFDPDRFLPEEFEKIPRGAYMPFSLPPRNCIGSKFAVMSMKVTLSTILRNIRVVSCQYNSVDEIKFGVKVLISATNGYGITLQHRLKEI